MNHPDLKDAAARIPFKGFLAVFCLSLLLAAVAFQFPQPVTLDVGSGLDTPFVQGFSFREEMPDGTDLRWSTARGELRLVGLGAQDGTLTLRLNVPPQLDAPFRVRANDRILGEVPPTVGFEDRSYSVSRELIGARGDLTIVLDGPTFIAPPDTRALGVQVERAQFISQGAPIVPAPRALLYLPALAVLAAIIGRVWSGSARVGWIAGGVTALLGALGIVWARVETVYFVEPLFWGALIVFAAALGLVWALDRLTRVLAAPTLARRTLRLLFLVMVLAFAVRMVFAVGAGYIVDVQDFVVWSYKTVTYGLGTMYSSLEGLWFSDQPPGLNYVLHVMALLYRAVFSPDFLYPGVAGEPSLRALTTNPALLADPAHRTLLRLPMLLADLATGALIFAVARRYVTERGAWAVALAYWFNPAVLWNGAYWGQTDAWHTLLVFSAFLLIVFARRVSWAFLIYGVAALSKPQALIFGPLLLLLAWRAVAWRGVARAVLFGAVGAALMVLPVALAGGTEGILGYFDDKVGYHPNLTLNAHNLWWFLVPDRIQLPDTAGVFPGAPLSFRALGILLFGAAYLLTVLRGWRAPLEDYISLGAYLAFAFFILPTEIHENHGYALLPLLAVAMTRDRVLVVFYAAVSATMTLNYALHDPNVFARAGLADPDAQLAALRWLNALANMILFGAWTLYLFVLERLPLAKNWRPQTLPR